MSTVGSDEKFLRFYESYGRSDKNKLQSNPKGPGDFRERVERDSIRGRYAVFHENIEMYLYRHWRAYTCPRVAVFWIGSVALMQHGFVAFDQTFPNITAYKRFKEHPNYRVLGAGYSWFYLLRPVFWTYVCFRMTRFLYNMIKRHWEGKDDQHYFWYYDTLYPDLLHDEEDMRYINFRYTDQKVSPDGMTGYYPYAHQKYDKFLHEKTDTSEVYSPDSIQGAE